MEAVETGTKINMTKESGSVKKFYIDGKKFWISRHDALALDKALLSCKKLSDSTRKRLRKGLWNDILKPLYLYEINCSRCKCVLKVVYDKKFSLKEVEEINRTKDLVHGDLGVICGACFEKL